MVLKTELLASGNHTVLRLMGQITSSEVQRLKVQISEVSGSLVLDLTEVDGAGLDAAHFLAVAELRGIELRHVSRYLREWISLERWRVSEDEALAFTKRNQ